MKSVQIVAAAALIHDGWSLTAFVISLIVVSLSSGQAQRVTAAKLSAYNNLISSCATRLANGLARTD
jgi:hypothetical protein